MTLQPFNNQTANSVLTIGEVMLAWSFPFAVLGRFDRKDQLHVMEGFARSETAEFPNSMLYGEGEPSE